MRLDLTLSLNERITNVVRRCYFRVRTLHHIRLRLMIEATNAEACGLVGLRLDHCNSLFYGMSEQNVLKI